MQICIYKVGTLGGELLWYKLFVYTFFTFLGQGGMYCRYQELSLLTIQFLLFSLAIVACLAAFCKGFSLRCVRIVGNRLAGGDGQYLPMSFEGKYEEE